jgi:hypothetical protein
MSNEMGEKRILKVMYGSDIQKGGRNSFNPCNRNRPSVLIRDVDGRPNDDVATLI